MSDNSHEILKRAEERYQHLKENAAMIPAVSDKINIDVPPPWYDAEMFAKAQQIAQRNYIRSVWVANRITLAACFPKAMNSSHMRATELRINRSESY